MIFWNNYQQKDITELIEKLDTESNIRKKYKITEELFRRIIKENKYPLNVHFAICKESKNMLLMGNNGLYSHNEQTVYLNENIFFHETGQSIYSIIIHEIKHAEQDYLTKNKEKYPELEEYINLLDIYMHKTETYITFCNVIKRKECLNISYDGDIRNLTYIFYKLSLPEREAYKEQNKHSDQKFTEYKKFNDEYHTNLSEKEIESLVDICFMNLYYQRNPKGTYEERNLQATVMYDISCLAYYFYEMNNVKSEESILDILSNIKMKLSRSAKQKTLAEYGYTLYQSTPINDLQSKKFDYIQNKDSLKELSIEKQRANPCIIMQMLYEYGNYIIPDIKDKEAFLYEAKYYIDSSQYGPVLLEYFPELKEDRQEEKER